MPRSFNLSFESPATVEQVYSTLRDEDYWFARIAAFAAGTILDSLVVDSVGAVTVITTQDLRHDALPGLVAKLYPRDLGIVRTETWSPIGAGRVSGDVGVAVTGAPVSGGGTALLEPLGTGSRLEFTGAVGFEIPLLGSRIENYLAGQLAQGISDIQRFTTSWITEHA